MQISLSYFHRTLKDCALRYDTYIGRSQNAAFFVRKAAYAFLSRYIRRRLQNSILYTSLASFVFRGTIVGGIGKFTDNLTMREASVGMQSWYFGELIYGVLSILIRISVGLYLLRICRSTMHKKILYVSLTIVGLTSTVYFFATLFQCSPPKYYWEQFLSIEESGSCESSLVTTTAIVLSVVAGTSDWVIAMMPAVVLWNIRISQQSKIIIVGLMSLGVLAGIAIIVRIPFIKGLEITKEFLYETV
ncbi:integral membrane [Fusarium albosuccineum]|uniref:Integral membrane n=1 Tax=Fusarium albosuccineum TaxID=1237068 RepID=A0A8H4LM34_9HYPO|nr:integral membrane [Fusarium albosuccineum]